MSDSGSVAGATRSDEGSTKSDTAIRPRVIGQDSTEGEDGCYHRQYGEGGYVRDRKCGEEDWGEWHRPTVPAGSRNRENRK